ncbi:MAG: nuclear transport factor 2 family protein [Crinalium sp.]
MSKELIEKAVAGYFDNMVAMNPQGWVDNFAEDGIVYDPVGNPPSMAHETFQDFFGMLSSFFKNIEISKDSIFISANQAAVKWTMKVVAKNDKNASAEGISIFEINEAGKIQKVSAYWDDVALRSQLQGSKNS